MVVTSGVTPKYSWAQPLAMRKPVITSSKHSTAPSCARTVTTAGHSVRQQRDLAARQMVGACRPGRAPPTALQDHHQVAPDPCNATPSLRHVVHACACMLCMLRSVYLGAQLAQALQELLGGGDEAAVAHHGLQDQARNLPLVGLKQGLRGRGGRGGGGALSEEAGGCREERRAGRATEALLVWGLVRSIWQARGGIALPPPPPHVDALQVQSARGLLPDRAARAKCTVQMYKPTLTLSRLLYWAVRVAAAVVAGTPGESDRPRVSTPLPACASGGGGDMPVPACQVCLQGFRPGRPWRSSPDVGVAKRQTSAETPWQRTQGGVAQPDVWLQHQAVPHAAPLCPASPAPGTGPRGRGSTR